MKQDNLKREKQEARDKAEKEKERDKAEREKAKQQQAAEDKKKQQAADAKAKADAKSKADADKAHADNVRRLQSIAGATGGETATGNAQRASGPSGSYGGKVAAKVKPNIVFTEDIAGNPTADVEVRTSPDGTIISRRLIKSSGNKAWDDAVLRAIDKTETLPRDVDGRVPPNITIGFRPRD